MKRLINCLGPSFKFGSNKRKAEQVFAIADELLKLTDDIQINTKKALTTSPLVRKTICLVTRHAGRTRFGAVKARLVRVSTLHELFGELS